MKVTFDNKQDITTSTAPTPNKIVAADLNEIKKVVNDNDSEFQQNKQTVDNKISLKQDRLSLPTDLDIIASEYGQTGNYLTISSSTFNGKPGASVNAIPNISSIENDIIWEFTLNNNSVRTYFTYYQMKKLRADNTTVVGYARNSTNWEVTASSWIALGISNGTLYFCGRGNNNVTVTGLYWYEVKDKLKRVSGRKEEILKQEENNKKQGDLNEASKANQE